MNRLRAEVALRDLNGLAHATITYNEPVILDGLNIVSLSIHRYAKRDMPAWRKIVAVHRGGVEPTSDPPPHYFAIARTARNGVHPVMLALAPLANGEFAVSALPRNTRHPFADLKFAAVTALGSDKLRTFATLTPMRV